jgi:hypothetical protein
MSFRCDVCHDAQRSGTTQTLVVIEKREKAYSTFNPKTKQTKQSKGWEIVKEIKACPRCVRELSK